MKKQLNIILSALFFAGITFISSAQAMTELTFVCENKQDFPTVMGNTNTVLEEKPGMGVEAIRMLEKELNIKITIMRKPWKRCLAMLEKGTADGVFTASFKEKRKQYGRFPEKGGNVDTDRRYSSAAYALFKLKGSNVSFDGNAFQNISGKVGAPAGYSIVDDLRKKGLSIEESPSTVNDFKKLIKGRVQAVAALEMSGDFYIQQNEEFKNKIEKVTPLIVSKPYYFMVSHQLYNTDKALAEKIFDTIARIREIPEYKSKLGDYL